ncbi:MAG TPA: adenylate/guanylate cyclase domain-containing protein [Actinomycetota bacterium]|nr:adenylate/guanylate cyclase domain-containing protein [Actinomycetota bacterium]
MDDRAPSPEDLQRENRLLARKLARMDTNVRQMEEMQDSTSKLLSSVMRELDQERARSHSLLLNILPQAIIDRLGDGETTIADRYASVTVLFSDLVGFTSISSELEPQLLVSELNRLFSEFDALCERTEVEKIKTIGDAYLAVGGLPGTRADHATAVAELALGMVEAVARLNVSSGRDWRIRIGVHSGPAVAGVIGTRKFVYDVWGDTVNVANRLESSAEPNRIHVSEPVAEALRGTFDLEPRGTIDLKGKGDTKSFLLRGPAG